MEKKPEQLLVVIATHLEGEGWGVSEEVVVVFRCYVLLNFTLSVLH